MQANWKLCHTDDAVYSITAPLAEPYTTNNPSGYEPNARTSALCTPLPPSSYRTCPLQRHQVPAPYAEGTTKPNAPTAFKRDPSITGNMQRRSPQHALTAFKRDPFIEDIMTEVHRTHRVQA